MELLVDVQLSEFVDRHLPEETVPREVMPRWTLEDVIDCDGRFSAVHMGQEHIFTKRAMNLFCYSIANRGGSCIPLSMECGIQVFVPPEQIALQCGTPVSLWKRFSTWSARLQR